MAKLSLDSLFSPKSIAIVGASSKKGKVGTVITENILKLGYRGKVYFVNPSYRVLKFKKCHANISSIKKEIDLAIIAVPAKFVADVIRDAAENVKNFVVISAGFSETGAEGKKREVELENLAKKHKLNILGPNCLGFISPENSLNASFAGGMPQKGNISFVSQSGALAVALMDKAKGENLGFAKIISVGNKMQLDESELLTYLEKDKSTKVIGMYLEGIKNGSDFIEVARRVSKTKPIVILKAGKTEKAQLAIASHTGALAGSDEIMDVAFKKAGVIRANDLEEFFNLLTLISFTDAPKNNKVAVVTNAGGAGVLTTDVFKKTSLELFEFSQSAKKELKRLLPAESSVENPIDLLGDAQEDRYEDILKKLKGSEIGTVIPVLTPQQQTPVEKIAKTVIEFKTRNKKTLVTIFIGGEKIKNSILKLKSEAIPNFGNPDSAVLALDKYYQWEAARKEKEVVRQAKFSAKRQSETKVLIEKAKQAGRSALTFSESAFVMAKYGLNSVSHREVQPADNNFEVGSYPVVLKVDSDKVLHKTDKQGVVLNLKTKEELALAVEKLRGNFPGENLLVQKMQEKQMEIILGIKNDPVFGPVIVFGLGGIYAEVFKMVNFLIPPLSARQMENEILSSKIGFLFKGARGQKAYNLEEFVAVLGGLAAFALENREVREFDINPLFIYNDGREASAVDIKILI